MPNITFQSTTPAYPQSILENPKNVSTAKPLFQLVDVMNVEDVGITKKGWNERAIAYLDRLETQLDEKNPNLGIQNAADQIGQDLKAKFSPLKQFNKWLDSNGQGNWYTQLATFLAKLPARAARNIVNILYQ